MDPLSQLNDISMGEPIGYWPLAWGWWVLFILLVAVFVGIGYGLYQRYKFNIPRKHAIKTLQQLKIRTEKDNSHNQSACYAELNQILKRVAKHYFGSEYVSRLFGDDWIEWLQKQLPKKYRAAFANDMQTLYMLQFKNHSVDANNTDSFAAVFGAAMTWLTKAKLKSIEVANV